MASSRSTAKTWMVLSYAGDRCDVSGPFLLALALAGVTEVRGVYKERLYTGACDREGVPGWQDGPAGGKRLFVRVAGDAPAPALAETWRPF
jgi:hypothetical protein